MDSMEKFTANIVMPSILGISKSPVTKVGWMSKPLWERKASATLVLDVTERFLRLKELSLVWEITIKIVSVVLSAVKSWIRLAVVKVCNKRSILD